MGPTNRVKNKGAYQPQAFNVVCLVEEIWEHFLESGVASDLAYYELVVQTERYLYSTFTEEKFVEYLEMVFGIDQEAFKVIFAKAEKNYNDFNAQLHGEEPK